MLQFIKSQAPGATVYIEKIQGGPGENTEGMRRFMIELGDKTARSSGIDIYSLPCDEDLLGKHIRTVMSKLK